MKTDEIIDAARACAGKIHEACLATGTPKPAPKRLDDLTRVPWNAADGMGHLLFMCDEIEKFIEDALPHGYAFAAETLKIEPTKLASEWTAYAKRREKAMRWLGFVQGTLWGWGFATIEELKKMNAPTGEG